MALSSLWSEWGGGLAVGDISLPGVSRGFFGGDSWSGLLTEMGGYPAVDGGRCGEFLLVLSGTAAPPGSATAAVDLLRDGGSILMVGTAGGTSFSPG